MTESLNKLINDKAVCRTAPATPGLLKRGWDGWEGLGQFLNKYKEQDKQALGLLPNAIKSVHPLCLEYVRVDRGISNNIHHVHSAAPLNAQHGRSVCGSCNPPFEHW